MVFKNKSKIPSKIFLFYSDSSSSVLFVGDAEAISRFLFGFKSSSEMWLASVGKTSLAGIISKSLVRFAVCLIRAAVVDKVGPRWLSELSFLGFALIMSNSSCPKSFWSACPIPCRFVEATTFWLSTCDVFVPISSLST